jgi:RNA-binding protein YhbY
LIQSGEKEMTEQLLVKKIIRQSKIQEVRRRGIMILVHKKGEKADPSN